MIYCLIQKTDRYELVLEIDLMLKKGWELLGGISTVLESHEWEEQKTVYYTFKYTQAMFKREGILGKIIRRILK